jgi:hypothetical protein
VHPKRPVWSPLRSCSAQRQHMQSTRGGWVIAATMRLFLRYVVSLGEPQILIISLGYLRAEMHTMDPPHPLFVLVFCDGKHAHMPSVQSHKGYWLAYKQGQSRVFRVSFSWACRSSPSHAIHGDAPHTDISTSIVSPSSCPEGVGRKRPAIGGLCFRAKSTATRTAAATS